MLKLEITQQEKDILIKLIDLAVKAGGLQVSEVGTILAKKIGNLQEEHEIIEEDPKKEKKPAEKPAKK